MDPLDFLVVRFHFNGAFVRDGQILEYVGGREEIAHVEGRTLSLDSIIVNLKVHYSVARRDIMQSKKWHREFKYTNS